MSLSYGFCLGEESCQYSAEQFLHTFQAIVGEGICPYGGEFEISATEGLQISVATGFALLAGRWFRSDETISLNVQPADNHFDRYDAIVVRADLVAKSVSAHVITGKAAATPQKYKPDRNNEMYEIVLCYILVRMGTTQILTEDLMDTRADQTLCGRITQLSDISNKVLRVYRFLESGIDERVDSLIGQADAIAQKGDNAINSIKSAMDKANASKSVGEIEILLKPPKPAREWLLCDGKTIPADYETLHKLLHGSLPNLSKEDSRFLPWIFAGNPKIK